MLPNKGLIVCLLLPLIFASDAKYQDIEDISKTLDELLVDVRSFRRPRDLEDTSLIWQKYEFNTGVGNREEVVVTNISLHTYANIPEKDDWQFLRAKNAYFVRAEGPTLLFYEINLDELSVKPSVNVTTEGRILLFRVFPVEDREDQASYMLAVLFVESEPDYLLFWYRISGNAAQLCLKLSMQHEFQDMEVVRKGNQNELLLLHNNIAYLGQSLIFAYGFNYDHSNHSIDMWFCRRLYVPKTSDVQVCPGYSSTMLAFRTDDSVVLYASRNEDANCKYEELEVIESNKLANFVCFESGHIKYLVIAGRETHLFHFVEHESQDNPEVDLFINGTTGISWITAMPLNTYRDESLMLAQFQNSTVIALTWQGANFKEVPLPSQIMNDFDLSRVVVVPEIGFMHGNTLVRVDVILRELAHPTHKEMDYILKTRVLLEDVFRKQEMTIDKTEEKVNQSYLKHPVTGFWNLSGMEVSNVAIGKGVKYGAIKVGAINLQAEDISTNITSSRRKLEELEARLDQVLPNLETWNMTNAYKMNIVLPTDFQIKGDFQVNGVLHAKNLRAPFVNEGSITIAIDNNTNGVADFISGRKSFPTINTDNLTVVTLNGIPLEEYIFDTSIKSYDNVDFSRPKRLKINGHLKFSEINDINWENLMQNIVWKDETRIIPGYTIVKGEIIVNEGSVKRLNDLRYPQDYVPKYSATPVNVTGEKYFSNLFVTDQFKVKAINDIDIDDFIILSRHEVLDREITFQNLQIDAALQIDGNITGINITDHEKPLNETDTLNTDVIFEDLIVMGNIVLRGSIDGKTWSDFDDFLLKSETNATITGHKKFLSGVTLKSLVRVAQINGRKLSEFVTLDSDQQFPNLKRILANVTFGNVNLGAVDKLKDYIISEQNISSGCMQKVLFFAKTPVVDEISFKTIGQTTTSEAFFDKLSKSLRKVHFENLTLSALKADEITPNTINEIWNYTDLENKLTISTRQNLTGSLVVENLEIGVLDAKVVNDMPTRDLSRLLTHARSLYDDVFSGNATLQFLQVTGLLRASSINERNILDIYDSNTMNPVIFHENVTIENLTVLDFVNDRNLSELFDDAVRKTDRNVTFTGGKTFGNVTCESLNVRFINRHSVDDILDPDRQQELKGPVFVNGSITVLKSFNATGKIGNVFFRDITDRFKPLGNNSYALRGNFRFTKDVSVARLDASGPIQGSLFDNFLQRAVAKNDPNVTISGEKLFTKPIMFYDQFIIDGKLDDLDFSKFHEKAVHIDKPFSIDSKIIFKQDVYVRKNVTVKKTLEASTIMGVDMKTLQEDAIFLDTPTHFEERMILDNVTFQASVKVTRVNDLKMDELIPLHTDQFIVSDIVYCFNATYKNIQLEGHVNGYILDNIYTDTFTLHDDQNITGTIKVRGNVYAYNDFNVYFINDFTVNQIVYLNTNDTLAGYFMFKDSVIFNSSLRILGSLNDIEPIFWQGTAVMKTDAVKQDILKQWKVHGNVIFKKNVNASEILDGVNITTLSTSLAELNPIIEAMNERLNNVCESLNVLRCESANQIFKFDTFDYEKVLEFEEDIHDIRNIDLDNSIYLLVNHGDCSVTLLQYTSAGFVMVDEVPDVGLIDRWIFYTFNRKMYLHTVAKSSCGRSLNNIWKLEDSKLTHVLQLGNDTNFWRTYKNTYATMMHDNRETVQQESKLHSNVFEALVSFENERLNSSLYNDSTSTNLTFIRELRDKSSSRMPLSDSFNYSNLLSFKVGIFEREEHIYYNEKISQNHIYFWRNDASQMKILQTINAHRPRSFLIMNFDGLIETLLIFIENNEAIQIYEYRGIEGFVYRNSIKMKVHQLYKFKMRKYTYMEKRHYLAAVNGNRLTILEAKMQGEKLDLIALTSISSCSINACPRR